MLVEHVTHERSAIEAWDAYVAGHENATVYHELAWRSILRAGFGYDSWYLLARDVPLGPVRGVLPLFLVRTPFSSRLVSIPFRDRGGPLWDSPAALTALVAEAKAICSASGATSMRLKSLVPYPAEEARALGLEEARYWIRSVVHLAPTPDLWEAIGDKNRNMVRQAQRNGLQGGPMEITAETLRVWHGLHVATQKRLGLPPFPREFFASMAQQLGGAGRIALFGVRRDATVHAATILLLHRDTAIYAYSASDTAGQRWRANDLMVFEVMQWLAARQCPVFDLGSDSPRQENLLFFKRKWLAEQATIPHYFFGEAAHVDSSDGRYTFARKCFSALPAPVLAAVGGAIARYFG